MKRPTTKPAVPSDGKIDPAHLPFLKEIGSMIAARLLAEHRERQRTLKGGAS
jgi:hypothetical protein